MKTLLIVIALVVWCVPQAWAQVNLIKNPNFSNGAPFPSDWTFGSAIPQIYEVKRLDEKYGDSNVMEIKSATADMSGYLVQILPVQPDTWYRLSASIRQRGGKGLMMVNGDNASHVPVPISTNKYFVSIVGNPLVPRFIRKELMTGSDSNAWNDVSMEFTTSNPVAGGPKITILDILIGCYFSVSRIDVANVRLVRLDHPSPP
jgi:hypothetical protein